MVITDLASFMPQVCMNPMALLVDDDDDDDDDVQDKWWYCDPNWREYMIWFAGFYFIFRRWTIVQLEKHKGQGEFIQSYLRTELAITLRAAECYADNYTAWSHRAWLVDRFMYDKKKVIWIHTCLAHKLLNPLSSKSDQHQLSPCNINAL